MIDYNLDQFRQWLDENVSLSDPFSPESLRKITRHILMGRNYRLLTETNTKDKLFTTYLWLMDIVRNAKEEYGENWKIELFNELNGIRRKSDEQKNLLWWLLGLTAKGAVNLSILRTDLPEILATLINHIRTLFEDIGRSDSIDDTWLLMMAGSATLNIRGSQKSKIGKQMERVLIRAMLTMIGFTEEENMWLNIERDQEVEREADAEIATRRGRIGIEMGLIAPGNQEVIEDKIGRLGRNGVVIFDKIGPRSRVHQTAENHGVKLIQIRNNQPLTELFRHVEPLVNFELTEPPTNENNLREAIEELPDEIFSTNP